MTAKYSQAKRSGPGPSARPVDAATVNAAIRRLGIAHRAKTADLLIRHGVRIGQELLLLELAERGESTQAALAESARTEASTITVALRKLEAAGLVERTKSMSDARAHTVRLTSAGEALISDLKAVQQELADRIESAIAQDLDVPRFVALIQNVITGLER